MALSDRKSHDFREATDASRTRVYDRHGNSQRATQTDAWECNEESRNADFSLYFIPASPSGLKKKALLGILEVFHQ